MGLDGVNFGKDYAAKFQAEGQEVLNETRQTLANAGVTVPVGQPVVKTSNLDTPIKGAQLEHTEQPVAVNEEAKQEQPAENGSKHRVFAERTITDEASFKEVEASAEKKYEEMKEKGDLGTEEFNTYYDKKEYKAAEKARKAQVKAIYKQLRAEGKTKEFARSEAESKVTRNEYVTPEEQAKLYAKNTERIENIYATETFIDKQEYKAAEAERKAERKELVAQFRKEGVQK